SIQCMSSSLPPLPLPPTYTLFPYVTLFRSQPAFTITLGDINQAVQRFAQDTHNRYQFLKSDRERPVLAPDQLFLDEESLFLRLKSFPRLTLASNEAHPDFLPAPNVAVARRADDPLGNLRLLLGQGKHRIALCADSAGRRETLLQMLAEFGIAPDSGSETLQDFLSSQSRFALVIAPLSTGFGVVDQSLVLITENDLYPSQARPIRRGKRAQEHSSDVEAMVRDLSELREGDPVVHAQHGIGRYCGLIEMDLGEGQMEFLHLEYANGSTLYVPVAQLHVIARYSGADPDHAPLHQLG